MPAMSFKLFLAYQPPYRQSKLALSSYTESKARPFSQQSYNAMSDHGHLVGLYLLAVSLSYNGHLIRANPSRNVTVDDQSSSIVYSTGWNISQGRCSLEHGSYHVTSRPEAQATFSFKGRLSLNSSQHCS